MRGRAPRASARTPPAAAPAPACAWKLACLGLVHGLNLLKCLTQSSAARIGRHSALYSVSSEPHVHWNMLSTGGPIKEHRLRTGWQRAQAPRRPPSCQGQPPGQRRMLRQFRCRLHPRRPSAPPASCPGPGSPAGCPCSARRDMLKCRCSAEKLTVCMASHPVPCMKLWPTAERVNTSWMEVRVERQQACAYCLWKRCSASTAISQVEAANASAEQRHTAWEQRRVCA